MLLKAIPTPSEHKKKTSTIIVKVSYFNGWRREWDLNPRYTLRVHTRFRVEGNKPSSAISPCLSINYFIHKILKYALI